MSRSSSKSPFVTEANGSSDARKPSERENEADSLQDLLFNNLANHDEKRNIQQQPSSSRTVSEDEIRSIREEANSLIEQERAANRLHVDRMIEELRGAKDMQVRLLLTGESEHALSRAEKIPNIEYVKNIVVKYLETRDTNVLQILCTSLQLSDADVARIHSGQAPKGMLSWLG
ncbi:hypothetical protein GUITHDRAFT_116844 [Guillardia theta CCMP2712]|uniref:GRIP domain-containing protein n=1 Tax=Guillardia theta (strain CCMP2712) TaxID=905079 RepID=L1IL45_GUITC|nr:hypothetical protein GUITHDRAFT_116844 [Guillardia theta CCMP2712]EKX36978.1 hypothetical protein GUITHDRAFT_116844 [Guillardia theta CCMP2712]|eukprot:XP_005823958.1 hypothetical protein GUITHDRAFT_116844 [Guillardia theta CCMP2712]